MISACIVRTSCSVQIFQEIFIFHLRFLGYSNLFYVSSNNIPTKNIKDVIDYLFKNGYEDYNIVAIKEVCLINDVYQRVSDEVLLK